MTLAKLRHRMTEPETPQIEFKEARVGFSKNEALKYLCAFANEGGGHLVLGVTNKQPRLIVGSRAFRNVNALLHDWQQTLGRHIQANEHD